MNDKEVRILHFTSLGSENCGVGKYQDQYLVGMADIAGVKNTVFEVSPYQTRGMNNDQMQEVVEKLHRQLQDYDILHIQHEFSLFSDSEFRQLVETARGAGKKVIVTLHLSPGFAIKPVKLSGVGPRSLMHYAKQRKHLEWKLRNHIEPFKMADLLIVHNDMTLNSLIAFGIDASKIKKIVHPVYSVPEPKPSTEIASNLRRQDGDIIFCITGFLHRYKGILGAIRALKFLPANYKLALLGGVKADSDDVEFQDKVTDLIDQLALHDRVYITGFVAEDDRLNALIRECDVCVYPYDRQYYASLSSGSLNLAFANGRAVLAYPTESFKETAVLSQGALRLCDTFAYYELARELQRIDIPAQVALSKAYAEQMAWPKIAKELVATYRQLA